MPSDMMECPDCEGGVVERGCSTCRGSGEGMADGTRCSSCGGAGEFREQCSTCAGAGEIPYECEYCGEQDCNGECEDDASLDEGDDDDSLDDDDEGLDMFGGLG